MDPDGQIGNLSQESTQIKDEKVHSLVTIK